MTDDNRIYIGAHDNKISVEEPTAALRFVQREGRMVLQQQFAIKEFTTAHVHQIGQRNEWRDVPVGFEE